MANNNIILSRKSPFGDFWQLANSDILNLPNEIKASKQFCFWKYVHVKDSIKPAKVPYGYSREKKCLVPSLKHKNYWFTFDDFLILRDINHR